MRRYNRHARGDIVRVCAPRPPARWYDEYNEKIVSHVPVAHLSGVVIKFEGIRVFW